MTLILNGTDNSASVPAVTGTDTDTGIFYPSANEVAAAAGGSAIWNASSTFGFKNRIINGNFIVNQYQLGSYTPSGTAVYSYIVDRWAYNPTQASKMTWGQNLNTITPPTGFTGYLGGQVGASANVTVGSSDYFFVRQAIEGYNITDLDFGNANAKTITLSFWVRSSLTGTFGGTVENASLNRGYPFTYTVSAANTWEKKSVTIAGSTTGTWGTANGTGLDVRFALGAGSSFKATAGTWNNGDTVSATGAIDLIATNSATWYITGVQLEVGSIATSFDTRNIGTEFALCQRYYELNYPEGYPAGYNFGEVYPFSNSKPGAMNLIASDDTVVSQTVAFMVQKRTSPTVVIYSPNNGSSGFTYTYKGTGGSGNLAASVVWTSPKLWSLGQSLGVVNQANESYYLFSAQAEL